MHTCVCMYIHVYVQYVNINIIHTQKDPKP